MTRTLKLAVFRILTTGSHEEPAAREIDGHIAANIDWLDLRPAPERMNPDTKRIVPSCVENVLVSESTLTANYAKEADGVATLYDFITLDYSGGNDYDPDVIRVKDRTCQDGVYIPLSALEAIGYIPHADVEFAALDGVQYVKYRLALQSAGENRQCRATFSTYKWAAVAHAVSANAEYLHKPTLVPQKAVARLGLAKSGGTIVNGFDFTYVLVDDLTTDVI